MARLGLIQLSSGRHGVVRHDVQQRAHVSAVASRVRRLFLVTSARIDQVVGVDASSVHHSELQHVRQGLLQRHCRQRHLGIVVRVVVVFFVAHIVAERHRRRGLRLGQSALCVLAVSVGQQRRL